MRKSIERFLREEDGVTALEYGLLAAVIAGVLVFAGKTQIASFFESLFEGLTEAVTSALSEAETQ